MPYVTSMLMAGLATVGAWALVVSAAEPASKVPAAGTGDIHWPMDLASRATACPCPAVAAATKTS